MPDRVHTLNLCQATIQYQLTRSPRRRRTVEVSVDSSGGVRVAAPTRVPLSSIEEFLTRRRGWLTRQLDAQALRSSRPARQFCSGEHIPYLGQPLALVVRESSAAASAARTLVGAVEVTVKPADDAQRRIAVVEVLEHWYRVQAEAHLTRRAADYGAVLDLSPTRVFIRSQKHLWGSCSSNGVLRFNWRLVMAPPTLVDYVVVHELCHLRHPHHQRPFWEAVGAVLPDYRASRAELRRDGDSYRL